MPSEQTYALELPRTEHASFDERQCAFGHLEILLGRTLLNVIQILITLPTQFDTLLFLSTSGTTDAV